MVGDFFLIMHSFSCSCVIQRKGKRNTKNISFNLFHLAYKEERVLFCLVFLAVDVELLREVP